MAAPLVRFEYMPAGGVYPLCKVPSSSESARKLVEFGVALANLNTTFLARPLVQVV
jgi:hypothetical protein